MAVDSVYLFDAKKRIRHAIVEGIYELIHDEATYELDAEIDAEYTAKPGEFLGFFGVEGFLLFEIDTAEIDDRRGMLMITATEAAVAELAHLIVPEIRCTGVDVTTAATDALAGSGWALDVKTQTERTADLGMYHETRWKALREIQTQWQVRVRPRFEFNGHTITGKVVEITDRKSVYRGRLVEGASGASQIFVTYSGIPVARMYGIGKAVGEEDPPTCVTFADVVWSREKGDPADKPAGQTYIEDAEAIALYGEGREGVFSDKNIEDPAELLEETWQELKKTKAPKVSGTATMADLEHIPGYEHQIARMHDMVWVRTRKGVDVTAAIINIKRNYMHRGRTKIMIGEEDDDSDLIKRIAKLSSKSSELESSKDSFSNRYVLTRQLIQMNADTIQMNARYIEANAETIRLTASNLKEYEEGTDERLTLAELLLYGDGTSAGAGLIAKVNQNEASLTLAVTELESKIELKADHVDIQGLVTTQKLQSEFTQFQNSITNNLYVSALSSNVFECSSFSLGGNSVKLKQTAYVKSVKRTQRHVLSPANISVDIWEISEINNGTLYYLSWE